ncbi:hypothetical protein BKK51_07035 [Rodentibacter trehalosifermentans]|uniref:Lipoprotein n=2 Tax=Rodentibacter trehalosifermentans TaxID=1908263 RepID=A0A1V3ITQ4_9PAST|nr:hypothetical protein [Rodentibacter trehalosifermentans]OOF45299.1 hypothetical protein BKK51_07035 [Rodentibacter trehalosifermentans]
MKSKNILLPLLCFVVLGCDDPKKANNENFERVISAHINNALACTDFVPTIDNHKKLNSELKYWTTKTDFAKLVKIIKFTNMRVESFPDKIEKVQDKGYLIDPDLSPLLDYLKMMEKYKIVNKIDISVDLLSLWEKNKRSMPIKDAIDYNSVYLFEHQEQDTRERDIKLEMLNQSKAIFDQYREMIINEEYDKVVNTIKNDPDYINYQENTPVLSSGDKLSIKERAKGELLNNIFGFVRPAGLIGRPENPKEFEAAIIEPIKEAIARENEIILEREEKITRIKKQYENQINLRKEELKNYLQAPIYYLSDFGKKISEKGINWGTYSDLNICYGTYKNPNIIRFTEPYVDKNFGYTVTDVVYTLDIEELPELKGLFSEANFKLFYQEYYLDKLKKQQRKIKLVLGGNGWYVE